MPMKPRELTKKLEAAGYRFVRANGSHFMYRHPDTGKPVVVPVHAKELKKGTEEAILKQAGLK